MSTFPDCQECEKLFRSLEFATLQFFKLQSGLDIARYSYDFTAVDRIAAELAAANDARSAGKRNLDRHRLEHTRPALSACA